MNDFYFIEPDMGISLEQSPSMKTLIPNKDIINTNTLPSLILKTCENSLSEFLTSRQNLPLIKKKLFFNSNLNEIQVFDAIVMLKQQEDKTSKTSR